MENNPPPVDWKKKFWKTFPDLHKNNNVNKDTCDHLDMIPYVIEHIEDLITQEVEGILNKIEEDLLKECICDGVTICDYHNGTEVFTIAKNDWIKLKSTVKHTKPPMNYIGSGGAYSEEVKE